MTSTSTVPTAPVAAPSSGFLGSLRRVGSFLAAQARQLAVAVYDTGARIARSVASALSVKPAGVIGLVLAALVIVALVFGPRA